MALRQGYTSTATVTRPDDTTGYGAGDVVGGAFALGPLGAPNATVMIVSSSLRIDSTGVIAGETSYTLHLYSATPPSAIADNAVWDLPAGDRSVYLGYVTLGTPVDMGSTLWVETPSIQKMLKLATSTVYGYLVTVGAYTPTALRVYTPTLHSIL